MKDLRCWKGWRPLFRCYIKGKTESGNKVDRYWIKKISTIIQGSFCFFYRCPKEVYPHVTTIINICLKYLTYDPNYNYDDEDEDENAMDADGGDDDDQGISN